MGRWWIRSRCSSAVINIKRHAEIENEQRHDDGEDTIGKRDQTGWIAKPRVAHIRSLFPVIFAPPRYPR